MSCFLPPAPLEPGFDAEAHEVDAALGLGEDAEDAGAVPDDEADRHVLDAAAEQRLERLELAQRQVDGPLQVIHQLFGMDVRALLGKVPLLALGNAIDVAQA